MSAVELPGSMRPEPENARILRDAHPEEPVSVTVHLKPGEQPAPSPSQEMTEVIERFAASHGLVARHHPLRRCVFLHGAVQQMTQAFETSLRIYDDGVRRFRARSGPLRIPEELAPFAIAVLGLDRRPVVTRHLSASAQPIDGDGLWPSEVASLYGLGPALDAPGECVGIIALGGGYSSDDFAAAMKNTSRPLPIVVDCPVNGVQNLFGVDQTADQEIALDLQVIAGLVPSARIAVYFAENNIKSLADAIRQAIADSVNRPKVLSISWGSAEKFWAEADRNALQSAFEDAAKIGITVVAAAGDYLATAGVPGGAAHVLFPASSPLVLACGGTQIALDASTTIASETVWHDGSAGTGGGISDVFEVPDYQQKAAVPASFNDKKIGRGIPDVCGVASHDPGYRIIYNGQPMAMQGTSAVAPLWASLVAMANAQRGFSVGNIHSFLYANSTLCRRVIHGDNRIDGVGYEAGPDWNACAGLGVPNSDTVDGLVSIQASQSR
jgi:kumamolisin